jgi:hypothetical protein
MEVGGTCVGADEPDDLLGFLGFDVGFGFSVGCTGGSVGCTGGSVGCTGGSVGCTGGSVA